MWNARLDEAQAGPRLLGEISISSDMLMTLTLWEKAKRTKEPLDESESEKASLKLNIQKTKIMAFSSLASRQIDGEATETVMDFILGGSKITADGDSSHEIKRHSLGEKL